MLTIDNNHPLYAKFFKLYQMLIDIGYKPDAANRLVIETIQLKSKKDRLESFRKIQKRNKAKIESIEILINEIVDNNLEKKGKK